MKSKAETPQLYGLTQEEAAALLSPEPEYRAAQLMRWLTSGTAEFEKMSNLPAGLRRRLTDLFGPSALISSVVRRESDEDGTVKLLIELHDSLRIESVLLTDEEGRKTACLSSQAGCAMGCTFCRTASLGLQRSLSAAEIVEQYLLLSAVSGPPTHIVYMGMGEPLANLDAVLRSIEIFHDSRGFGIGARKMTVSTCGLPEGIRRLADERTVGVRLAVSLTSADDALRSQLMPVNRSAGLSELKQALTFYQGKRHKRITLEYVLLGGLNDSRKAADQLIDFARGLDSVINVIPWNPGAGLPYQEPSGQAASRFCRLLESAGLKVTRRYRRGRGVNGACGQLAGDSQLQ
jgi:23S rRNA (adenine2503-C2)-methyltransferase